ncbi:MAG: cytochrome c [Betaproteobacteria bacterium]|jgi:mono/diheme cytochrome c family protein|nr:cytochrome c [Betaproteobacteria bacterium]
MKRLDLIRVLAAAAVFVASGQANADSTGKWQSSQEIYDKVCGYCHEANVGPVITGRNLMPEYIQAIVRNGNRAMPAFRESEINDAALAGVVKLVSTSPAAAKK